MTDKIVLIILLLVLYLLLKKKIFENFDNSKDVIMTTYFCKTKDLHKKKFAPCDDFTYIKPWYNSVKSLGLNGIIFHDGMSDEFINQYQTDKIKFEFVDSSKFELSLNDQRFIVYYEYLLKNPEIKNVFMTDGNDVKIVKNPFGKFDKLCVGSQVNYSNENKWIQKKYNLFNNEKHFFDYTKKNQIVYNAGILGGDRNNVLLFLKKMKEIFENLDEIQKKKNLNMVVFNYVVYNNFKNNNITGEKLHSKFKKYENNRKDIYFIHK